MLPNPTVRRVAAVIFVASLIVVCLAATNVQHGSGVSLVPILRDELKKVAAPVARPNSETATTRRATAENLEAIQRDYYALRESVQSDALMSIALDTAQRFDDRNRRLNTLLVIAGIVSGVIAVCSFFIVIATSGHTDAKAPPSNN